MSKYFKFKKHDSDSVRTIRKYLEEVGEVNCTNADIIRLWTEFSDSWDSNWLNPDEDTLKPFSHWLANYDDDDDAEVIDDSMTCNWRVKFFCEEQ